MSKIHLALNVDYSLLFSILLTPVDFTMRWSQ